MITEQELKGHWNSLSGKLKAKWGQLTDDDLARVEGNVEQLVGRIQQKTGEARRNIETFLDESVKAGAPLMQSAHEAAANVAASVKETYKAAETSVKEGYKAAESTVKEGYKTAEKQVKQGYQSAETTVQHNPTESMAVVLGVGIMLGAGIAMLFRSES